MLATVLELAHVPEIPAQIILQCSAFGPSIMFLPRFFHVPLFVMYTQHQAGTSKMSTKTINASASFPC